MHSATANDYMPNGPLLLVRTHLHLHALPQPECPSVLRNGPAGQEVPLQWGCGGKGPLCREMPPPQSTRALLWGRKARARRVAAVGGVSPAVPCLGAAAQLPAGCRTTPAMTTHTWARHRQEFTVPVTPITMAFTSAICIRC